MNEPDWNEILEKILDLIQQDTQSQQHEQVLDSNADTFVIDEDALLRELG